MQILRHRFGVEDEFSSNGLLIMILALGIYFGIGALFAFAHLWVIQNGDSKEPDWERARTHFEIDPQRSGLIMFAVCMLFWGFMIRIPSREQIRKLREEWKQKRN